MDFKKAIGLALLLALVGPQSATSASRQEAPAQEASRSAPANKLGAAPEDPSLAFTDGDSAFVKESLDQKKIHALYNNGDFEPVIAVLEGFIRRNKAYSHSDSVFIAKHLAVVYTANPDTRERGRYYMYRLLELLPSAKLVDMYVSEEVDRIFDRVREEFMVRQRGFGVDTTRITLPERPGKQKPEPEVSGSGMGKTLLWSAGGAVLLLTGTWFWLQTREETTAAPIEDVDVTVITPKN